jgi:hypothetical protein
MEILGTRAEARDLTQPAANGKRTPTKPAMGLRISGGRWRAGRSPPKRNRGLCLHHPKAPYIDGAAGAAAFFARRLAGFFAALRAGFLVAFFATFRFAAFFATFRFAGFFAALRAGFFAAALRTVVFFAFAAFLRAGFLFAVIGI